MNPYQYSGAYYHPQLPGGYPPVYWHPAYPPAGYVPVALGRSPRHRRQDLTPSPPPELITHPILNRSAHLRWSVTYDPFDGPRQYFPTANSNPTHIPNQILGQPATKPPVTIMRIVCEQWSITIDPSAHGPSRVSAIVTVKHVLGAIWGTLQEPIPRSLWDQMRSNERKNAHRARCDRIANSQAKFEIGEDTGAIKKVDLLGNKLVFLGLRPVGPMDDPDEWIVKLGPLGR
ncbi:hypothetical protein BU17DRAFT_93472 [Hysterangium stoloniferum]|nr:hypothetical protein BU17DRAFT_93472 [Hysterangium stoloniferum]